MKKLISLAILMTGTTLLMAQSLPAPSPKAKVFQTVGLTDIEIEYSSPAVNNRTIFGDLVPYNKLWRTGANRATKITFSTPITFSGKEIPAGTYALFVTPSEKTATVALNSNANQGGTSSYDPSLDVAKIELPFAINPVSTERMRFTIEDFNDYGGKIVMNWEKRTLSIPFTVKTDEYAEKAIEEKMQEAQNIFGFYNSTANYYLRTGKDSKKAVEWAKMSVDMKQTYWNTHTLAKAYESANMKREAADWANKSLELSKEAKSDDYVKLNQELLKALTAKR